jgi:hypothetical protein
MLIVSELDSSTCAGSGPQPGPDLVSSVNCGDAESDDNCPRYPVKGAIRRLLEGAGFLYRFGKRRLLSWKWSDILNGHFRG